jgi:hypothetical protein
MGHLPILGARTSYATKALGVRNEPQTVLQRIKWLLVAPIQAGQRVLKMQVPRTYLRALITLDRTTIRHANRITAGGDLPRLQDTDARQVTSAAQVEHGPRRGSL